MDFVVSEVSGEEDMKTKWESHHLEGVTISVARGKKDREGKRNAETKTQG